MASDEADSVNLAFVVPIRPRFASHAVDATRRGLVLLTEAIERAGAPPAARSRMTANADAPKDGTDRASRRHLMVISGTGRTGTSFLVRYLAGLGLDTELPRTGGVNWDDQANAGLESMPIITPADKLPYVVKTPWMSEFIDQILAQPDLALDVVIIPVRDLVEAASSRVILEMRAIHASSPWMTAFDRTYESWGHTPGGLVYSLNPMDQARLLAVWFHNLVQRLIEADIPIVLLAFPRLVTDADYLFDKLRPFLPAQATGEAARAVHRTLADAEKVRVGDELASDGSGVTPPPGSGGIQYPDHDKLDRIAIGRELRRSAACGQYEAALQAQRQEEQALRSELERHKAEAARLQAQIKATPLRRLRRLLTGGR